MTKCLAIECPKQADGLSQEISFTEIPVVLPRISPNVIRECETNMFSD
jgi:hypothetical protein